MRRSLFQRIRHRLLRMRLHPIRVFVFHQVSESFEPDTMWECDWTQLSVFKRNILKLKEKYLFISLAEAKERLSKDFIRLKDYAVLTSDDGWASLANVLPWLAEQHIPVTLFLNPLNLDGKHSQSRPTDKLLTKEDILHFVNMYSPLITIASHGWTHQDCTQMTMEEFIDNVDKAEEELDSMAGKIPFYAFAFGLCTPKQVAYLQNRFIIPVFVDGIKNETDYTVIHRECIDGLKVGPNYS